MHYLIDKWQQFYHKYYVFIIFLETSIFSTNLYVLNDKKIEFLRILTDKS